MKYFASVLVLAVAAVVFIGYGEGLFGQQTTDDDKAAAEKKAAEDEKEPPLLLDDDPPLLLDDDPPLLLDDDDEPGMPKKGMADNSRCHVCHLNYVDEEIAVFHAKAKIGCADCHGECDEHIADESWADGGNGTAPDIMYSRAKVNDLCTECHERDELPQKAHKKFLAGTSKSKHCTDCHGEHRLDPEKRNCHWDKEGKAAKDDS